MGKKNENQNITVIPSFENYAVGKARAVAESAANAILNQTVPLVARIVLRYVTTAVTQVLKSPRLLHLPDIAIVSID